MIEQGVLETAEKYLRNTVSPKAQEIDHNVEFLREALQGLCDRDLMALRRPAEYGGPDLSEEAFRKFQETCARYSGALSFLQTQHQSAGSMIAKSDNEELKRSYLPKMGNGAKLVGIGFSQLRRGGPPIMRAEEIIAHPPTPNAQRSTPNSFRLNGTVPWMTGYGFYPEFLVGATLPDGRALFAVVPVEGEGIEPSEPMELAAMGSANTVSIQFTNVTVPPEQVVFVKEAEWIKNNDQINIALQGHFAIGCAQAGLDVIRAAAEKKDLPFLHSALESLAAELAECRDETHRAQAEVEAELATPRRLKVRAWAIDLAVRCAHAAVTASSGAANSLRHPAQRIYREALVYTVSAQTLPIMEATLSRLVRRERSLS